MWHIGQRVQAVWKPEDEWGYSMDNIRYFKPIDEPDVPVEMIGKLPVTGVEGLTYERNCNCRLSAE